MKHILEKAEIYAWDKFTIENEPIASVDLMWRASKAFCQLFQSLGYDKDRPIHIFCGSGNNGGDGIAIGLLLDKAFYNIHIHMLPIGSSSADRNTMENYLKKSSHIPVYKFKSPEHSIEVIPANAIIIDAIFGIGINKAIGSPWSNLINLINTRSEDIVAVDTPSGLQLNQASSGAIIKSKHTITFQSPKLSFFIPENEEYVGTLHIANIGLLDSFVPSNLVAQFIEDNDVKGLCPKRTRFVHKGTLGHACLVGGSIGMMGAVQLSAKACLRSGVGKLTIHVPECGIGILQTSVPEAMVQSIGNTNMTWYQNPEDYASIGVGIGLGQDPDTVNPLFKLIRETNIPCVLDADALNIIASNQGIGLLPPNCIITPHLKEFDRLFGEHTNQFDRFNTAKKAATKHRIIIILKGANTSIFDSNGDHYINSTGNPGMATAGSGDVLTGLITGLLAQGITPIHAAILGVYLHGLAADIAVESINHRSLIASDFISTISAAYSKLES